MRIPARRTRPRLTIIDGGLPTGEQKLIDMISVCMVIKAYETEIGLFHEGEFDADIRICGVILYCHGISLPAHNKRKIAELIEKATDYLVRIGMFEYKCGKLDEERLPYLTERGRSLEHATKNSAWVKSVAPSLTEDERTAVFSGIHTALLARYHGVTTQELRARIV